MKEKSVPYLNVQCDSLTGGPELIIVAISRNNAPM